MKVWVNGELSEVNGISNIAELAKRYDFSPNTVLIEHNSTALHQREWTETSLAEGDRVEFILVVAGG
jgi:thiamine biosynthesis protein ThiS